MLNTFLGMLLYTFNMRFHLSKKKCNNKKLVLSTFVTLLLQCTTEKKKWEQTNVNAGSVKYGVLLSTILKDIGTSH